MSQTRFRRRAASQTEHDAEYEPGSTDLERVLDARIELVVRRILGSAGSSVEYASDSLPPGLQTKKAFAKICASGKIIGAEQDGPRGAWRCPKSAWHTARSRPPPPRLELVSSVATDEQLADFALAQIRRGGR
jgi:hypothetical protein